MLVATFGGTMLVLLLAFLPGAAERNLQLNEGSTSLVDRPQLALRAALVAFNQRRASLRPAFLAFAIASASPLGAWALSTGVGSYTMFTRLVRYELTIEADGVQLPREVLARHLGRDGARIVKLANGHGIGETNVHILREALPKMATFVCGIRPATRRVRVELAASRIEGGGIARDEVSAVCGP
jgi:hypothetical protein